MGILSSIFRPKPSAVTAGELRGPVAWLMESEGGGGKNTTAGVSITEDSAMTLSAVFACARAIAEDIAKLPLKLYRTDGKGAGREEARDDDLYHLLHDAPNDEMSSFDFRAALILNAAIWGNGIAEIQRDTTGNAVALWPIASRRIEVKRDSDSRVYYRVRESGRESRDIPARDCLHIKGIGDTGIAGYMIAKVAAESFGVYMAAERFTASFFGKGTNPSGVVELPVGKWDDNQVREWRRQFNELYAGLGNQHQNVVLPGGAKFNKLTGDPEKSQLVQVLQFRIEDVARWFRVPPHKIQHLARSTNNNIEHQGIEYGQDTILPWVVRVEQELNRKLLSKSDARTMYFSLLMDVIYRADTTTRYNSYAQAITNGIMSPNEARAKENLNPYPGGDAFLVPMNMATVQADGTIKPNNTTGDNAAAGGAAPKADPKADAEAAQARTEAVKLAMMPAFVDAAARVVARECKAVEAKAKKPSELAEWLPTFYEGHRAHVHDALAPVIESMSRVLGVTSSAAIATEYAAAHVESSITELLAGNIAATLERWAIERPAAIAEHLTNEVAHV